MQFVTHDVVSVSQSHLQLPRRKRSGSPTVVSPWATSFSLLFPNRPPISCPSTMGRITVAVLVGLWVIPISIIVNRIVPHPYMVCNYWLRRLSALCVLFCVWIDDNIRKPLAILQDEIFHIPQAQEYCRANFRSWDPMITTPPGLSVFINLRNSFYFYEFWSDLK